MADLRFEGYETTAAKSLVEAIDDQLVGDWERRDVGPGLWSWRLGVTDCPMVVAVNALADRVLVPVHGWPAKMGPTIFAGVENGLFASATLPYVADRHDAREALQLLARMVPELSWIERPW